MVINSSFQVVIVGGSISGLTLAHCLDRAGIDYIVLEKHHDIHPQIGASIGILPNGGRILEQLGLFHAVEKISLPFECAHQCFPDGFYYDSNFPAILAERYGFSFSCLERKELLEILYTALKDKSRVHVRKKVSKIIPDSSGISVQTEDGSIYRGDLVVGADGVHSVTRSEMWRIANQEKPGLVTDEEKFSMFVEFSCIFGISTLVESVTSWQNIIRYNNGFTILIFPGTGSNIFWAVMQKLDKKYVYPNAPRFSREEAIAKCESLADLPVWQDVKFGDLWARRQSFTMSALEENLFKTWHYGRIVCIGDSVSKMTPNMGQGANTAIEAAAALSNGLRALLNASGTEKPSEHEIDLMLDRFNRTQVKRLDRIHKESQFVTRLEACDGLINRIFARYVAPLCGDMVAANIARTVTNGVVLDFIPLTVRTGKEWQPLATWEKWGMIQTEDFGTRLFMVVLIIFISVLLGRVVRGEFLI